MRPCFYDKNNKLRLRCVLKHLHRWAILQEYLLLFFSFFFLCVSFPLFNEFVSYLLQFKMDEYVVIRFACFDTIVSPLHIHIPVHSLRMVNLSCRNLIRFYYRQTCVWIVETACAIFLNSNFRGYSDGKKERRRKKTTK